PPRLRSFPSALLPVHQQLHLQSVKLLKFAYDTTLIGLISGGDESAYRWESDHRVSWCSQNNLDLEEQSPTFPHHPVRLPFTIVDSFCFLGSITQDLKWELNISSITKKAQQRLFFLRQLKKFNLPKTMMVHFYTAIIESILCSSITVWYAAATAKDKGRLQRVIRSAERVIGCNLPSLQDLFASRSLKRAKKIVADPSHPGQNLFVPLPSGRRLRSIRTKTSRHTNSFLPSAVGLINRARSPTD
uniref:Alkylated DNA repair protein AlkB homologue 8 N-terminal domain-containing protein n=1 Tax=Gasterosteus aculeatus aculeatus TaxID=481459 RepID=A0AAQ4QSM7_GASAC